MKKILQKLFSLVFLIGVISISTSAQNKPVHIGIDGLTHAHVHGLLQNINKVNAPVQIVGIAESNLDLAQRYSKQYGFDMSIVYSTVEEMIAKTKPEGVMAFNSIYEHLSTVEACLPKGIPVMVEKPLAVNMEHAEKMAKLSDKYKTAVLTNYETTWYASNHKVYDMVNKQHAVGDIRKVIICDGHEGPKEIGCNIEFLDWLTDPVLNGGGAVVDFGCYGANLMTWLMKNERPLSVSATLQQIKPDIYPKVDDEATIVVAYPKSQAIIQGSWNWPFGRKDMEVYGATGYVKALDADNISFRLPKGKTTSEKLSALPAPYNDPFQYFAAVIRGDIKVSAYDLSSLENNLIVVEILDAARESAKTGTIVNLKPNKAY
ncbi:Gfo/Idh/MocA family protein [Dysgonomonas sp. ZJ709]|uniref:Gfo/Idh/MocA family protein n=1 Tax=Dysgonomonas sp. ZJ709 TaxID=2709797 RepID=UPI0013EA917E|nr:Gfo/Idh/MocA family oxidoreductase [Dysgonomonas sp. ZJ709]